MVRGVGAGDESINALAERQHGVVSRAQVRASGLSRAAIRHRLDHGRLVEITPRVYRIAGAPESERAAVMATVLSAGADAVATASTGLALAGVRDLRLLPARVVIARRPHALSLPGVTETFRLPESQRCVVDGIPTATAARALFDLAGVVPRRRLERAVDAALSERRVTVPQLEAVISDLAERGRSGTANLRLVVAERADGYHLTKSELEHRFLELVRTAGFPVPECQVRFAGPLGWIGDVDFVWRTPRLIVETDGGAFHDSVTDRADDERRDRALEQLGWSVLRFGWIDVTQRPTSVVRMVRTALELAG